MWARPIAATPSCDDGTRVELEGLSGAIAVIANDDKRLIDCRMIGRLAIFLYSL